MAGGRSKTAGMKQPHSFCLALPTPESTTSLGHAIAGALSPGDCLLLTGTLGAGKSHLARAIIQARLGRAEDVPSPTFTLVQTYDAPDGDLWHADLYRLSHPDEVIELGLDEAFSSAISLIEWPDRLGDLTPKDAIRVDLAYDGHGRQAKIRFANRPALAEILHGWRA